MTIRVFLMDDHELVRRGLTDLIQSDAELEVVGQAGTCAEGLQGIVAKRPDIAILDVRLPDGSGIEVCRDLRSIAPEVNVLMLTSYADDEALLSAVLAGAHGYVLKDIQSDVLLKMIREISTGKSLLDPVAVNEIRKRLAKGSSVYSMLEDLTDQERRVLEFIGEGMSNRQIAEQMFLAEKTIKNYVSAVLAKLGMERRSQAAAFIARLGISEAGSH
jgi:two-component system, NarL family, response regulator DevR